MFLCFLCGLQYFKIIKLFKIINYNKLIISFLMSSLSSCLQNILNSSINVIFTLLKHAIPFNLFIF